MVINYLFIHFVGGPAVFVLSWTIAKFLTNPIDSNPDHGVS